MPYTPSQKGKGKGKGDYKGKGKGKGNKGKGKGKNDSPSKHFYGKGSGLSSVDDNWQWSPDQWGGWDAWNAWQSGAQASMAAANGQSAANAQSVAASPVSPSAPAPPWMTGATGQKINSLATSAPQGPAIRPMSMLTLAASSSNIGNMVSTSGVRYGDKYNFGVLMDEDGSHEDTSYDNTTLNRLVTLQTDIEALQTGMQAALDRSKHGIGVDAGKSRNAVLESGQGDSGVSVERLDKVVVEDVGRGDKGNKIIDTEHERFIESITSAFTNLCNLSAPNVDSMLQQPPGLITDVEEPRGNTDSFSADFALHTLHTCLGTSQLIDNDVVVGRDMDVSAIEQISSNGITASVMDVTASDIESKDDGIRRHLDFGVLGKGKSENDGFGSDHFAQTPNQATRSSQPVGPSVPDDSLNQATRNRHPVDPSPAGEEVQAVSLPSAKAHGVGSIVSDLDFLMSSLALNFPTNPVAEDLSASVSTERAGDKDDGPPVPKIEREKSRKPANAISTLRLATTYGDAYRAASCVDPSCIDPQCGEPDEQLHIDERPSNTVFRFSVNTALQTLSTPSLSRLLLSRLSLSRMLVVLQLVLMKCWATVLRTTTRQSAAMRNQGSETVKMKSRGSLTCICRSPS